jgi:hypothetical protein
LFEEIRKADITQNENYTTLFWEYVKWPFTTTSEFIEEFKKDIPHVFHRLGEDDNDYEYTENESGGVDSCDMYQCSHLVREIDTRCSGAAVYIAPDVV